MVVLPKKMCSTADFSTSYHFALAKGRHAAKKEDRLGQSLSSKRLPVPGPSYDPLAIEHFKIEAY